MRLVRSVCMCVLCVRARARVPACLTACMSARDAGGRNVCARVCVRACGYVSAGCGRQEVDAILEFCEKEEDDTIGAWK